MSIEHTYTPQLISVDSSCSGKSAHTSPFSTKNAPGLPDRIWSRKWYMPPAVPSAQALLVAAVAHVRIVLQLQDHKLEQPVMIDKHVDGGQLRQLLDLRQMELQQIDVGARPDQQLHNVELARVHRLHERGQPGSVPLVHGGILQDEHPGRHNVAVPGGHVQRRVAKLADRIDVRAGLDQVRRNFVTLDRDRHVQRCAVVRVAILQRRLAQLHDVAYQLERARVDGLDQAERFAGEAATVAQQKLQHPHVALLDRDRERMGSDRTGRLERSLMLRKHLRNAQAVPLDGPFVRRPARIVGGARVDTTLQQQRHHCGVPLLNGNV
uniref:Uncharacterized protein n=1 Tax=Anopheles coluzzii TaxID=1518534 RepID=A0A8W7PHL7_ANOCL